LDITDNVRDFVNGLEGLEEGISAPDIEMFPKESSKVYKVQKILTEIYVFTDIDNMKYGSKTFQDVIIMGDMTQEEVNTLIAKRKRKGG
jgi:hypothetical protein